MAYSLSNSSMNEMLGNYYFIINNYEEAAKEYKIAFSKSPKNYFIAQRLIICYLKLNETNKATELFEQFLSKNKTQTKDDFLNEENCPCKEMIYFFEHEKNKLNEIERETALGILWYYCDKKVSKKYFNKLSKKAPLDKRIINITKKLNWFN